MPSLDEKSASLLALGLALIGLLGLYFSPAGSYEKMAPAQAAIAEDGARVEIAGTVASVSEKESSISIRVCDGAGNGAELPAASCISVSAAKNAKIDYPVLKGDEITVFGQVATYNWARFIRVEKIIHDGADGS